MRSAGKGEPAPLFVLGSWQDLPGELAGLADSVSVLFPWGSLLQAAATADPAFEEALVAASRPGASVELVTAIDPATDANELRRLGLGGFDPARMRKAWQEVGLEAAQFALPSDHPYQTSWWRRIRQRPGRVATLTRLRLPGPEELRPTETPRSR